MTAETILAVMLALPPWYGDKAETLEQRTALYRPVAEAIYEATKDTKRPRENAALLVAQGWEDSHFARYVLEGRCADGPPGQRCDNGRSRGAFQVGRWCQATNVSGEALCALRAAWGGSHRCLPHSQSPIHGAFVGLAARECSWQGADRRVKTYQKVMGML